ncbi:MAG: hypothetical protein J6S67_00050 [Methanobrevibacter sp.]|nr:hypothetical protein [Methanobrevibacter sp.]
MATYEKKPTSQFWATEIYMDGITLEQLNRLILNMHQDCILSPYHNKDIFEDKTEITGLCGEDITVYRKERHYHFMIMFPRAVGEVSFKYLIDHKLRDYGVHCKGHECIKNGVAMARYFAHIDNPEKAQYKVSDYLYYGQIDESILGLDKVNKYQSEIILNQLIQYIIDYKCYNLIQLESVLISQDDSLIKYARQMSNKLERYCKACFHEYATRSPTATKRPCET